MYYEHLGCGNRWASFQRGLLVPSSPEQHQILVLCSKTIKSQRKWFQLFSTDMPTEEKAPTGIFLDNRNHVVSVPRLLSGICFSGSQSRSWPRAARCDGEAMPEPSIRGRACPGKIVGQGLGVLAPPPHGLPNVRAVWPVPSPTRPSSPWKRQGHHP